VERAFAEAGRAVPTREEAGLVLSREVARAIVEGWVEPYEGAQRMRTLAYDIGEQNFVKVAAFVVYASEIDDRPDSRAFYEPRIKEEAAQFLEEIAATG
jgi:LmbE family N-acetylglucosaminyl deacetylase